MTNNTTNVESVSPNVNSAGEKSSDSGWTRIQKSRTQQNITAHSPSPYLTRSYTRNYNTAGTDYASFNHFLKVIHPVLMHAHVSPTQTWLQTWQRTIVKTTFWNIIHRTFQLQTLTDLYNLLITCSSIQQQLHLQMTNDRKISYAHHQQPVDLQLQESTQETTPIITTITDNNPKIVNPQLTTTASTLELSETNNLPHTTNTENKNKKRTIKMTHLHLNMTQL